jgi:hypothetical protein
MVPGALGGLRMVDGIQVNQAKLSLPTGPNQPVTMLGDMGISSSAWVPPRLGRAARRCPDDCCRRGAPRRYREQPDMERAAARWRSGHRNGRDEQCHYPPWRDPPAMVPVLFRFVFRAPLIARHTP